MGKANKPIKICQIVSSSMTLRFMLFDQIKFLRNKGYEVHAVCSPGKWTGDIKKEGIKVKEIVFKRKISFLSDIISFFKLYFYFRREKFDIIHTHTLKPEFFGQIAGKLARVPIIFNTLHGFDFEDDASPVKKKFFIILEKIAAKCSTAIFSIGREIIKSAIREGLAAPEKFIYLGRDIDTDRFDPNKYGSEFIRKSRISLGVSPDSIVLGIVARLVAEKGFLELFGAMRDLLKSEKNISLLVVGPVEPEKKDSINLSIVKNYGIDKNVFFLGEKSNVEEIYPLIDIFILPTHREGLGAAILEASAMQRPVIASSVGGCIEAVDNGKTGLLIPARNERMLIDAIRSLLYDEEKRFQMGILGREKVIKEFSKEIVLARLGEKYNYFLDKIK